MSSPHDPSGNRPDVTTRMREELLAGIPAQVKKRRRLVFGGLAVLSIAVVGLVLSLTTQQTSENIEAGPLTGMPSSAPTPAPTDIPSLSPPASPEPGSGAAILYDRHGDELFKLSYESGPPLDLSLIHI